MHPLSVGEIFDRALTVYVKHWRPFTILGLLCALPAAWLKYYQSSVLVAYDMGPAGAGNASAPALARLWAVVGGDTQHENAAIVWTVIALSWLVTAAVYPAFLRGLTLLTDGRTSAVADWLRPGLARFGRLLGVIGIWLIALAALVVGFVGLLFVVLFIPIGLMGAISRVPIVTGISIAFIVIFAIVLVTAFAIPFDWSLFIATNEDKPAIGAFRAALARSLNRARFWRTVGIGAALFALNLIFGYVLRAAFAQVLLWTKSALLFSVLTSLTSLPFYAYSGLVVATYFLDARVRDAN